MSKKEFDIHEKVFDIHELSKASRVRERTIRHYIQGKLLPPPMGTTRAAVYTESHLARLLNIAHLKKQGLSNWQIKAKLEKHTSTAVIESLRIQETETRTYVSIADGLWVCYDPMTSWRDGRKLRAVVKAASEAASKIERGDEA